MPVKERTVRDTATHIAYVMQSVQIPNIPGTSVQPNINGQILWGYGASLVPAQAGSVWFHGQDGAWGRTVSGLIPYAPMDLTVGIGYMAAAPVTITVTEVVNGITGILQSVSGNSAGSYQLSFVPTGTQVRIEVSLSVSMVTAQNLFSVTSIYYTQQNGYINVPQLVQLSNMSKDRYEFGFNGKYKDNEIAGMGNSLDFGARTFNPRICRFISIDPESAKFPQQSVYSYAKNNPIYYVDEDGRSGRAAKTEEVNKATGHPILRVTTNVKLYGECADDARTALVNKDLNTQYNRGGNYFTYDDGNNVYDVVFDFKVTNHKLSDLNEDVKKGTIADNFYIVGDPTDKTWVVNSSYTFVNSNGGNAGVLTGDDIDAQNHTESHEINHGYGGYGGGRNHAGVPSTPPGRTPDISNYRGSTYTDGTPIQSKDRRVTQDGINNMLDKVQFDENGEGDLGRDFSSGNNPQVPQPMVPDPTKPNTVSPAK